MKETTCVSCGAKIGIDDETAYGQHVLCPYCGKKFSYLEDSVEFSAERLSYAIAESRKDASDNRYYSAAPAGARLYIGLVFYGKVFGEGMDLDAYMAALSEIEPELTASDWQYLLDNEMDAELKEYFLGRLEGMQGSALGLAQNRERKTQVPAVGILRSPASKPNLPQNPLVTKRLAEAERHRSESEKIASGRPRKKDDGRLVVIAGLVAASIVGVILFLAWPTEPERKPEDVQPPAPTTADASKPQDALLSAVVGRLSELRERKELVRQSLSEVRADRRRLESELARVIENGNLRSAAAQAGDSVRLNGAETAIAVLKAPFYNALAARYCDEKPSVKADACRKMVQDALAAKKTLTPSAMEAISSLAISYQENAVGEVRRGMDAVSNRLTALSNDIVAAIRTLNQLQGSVAGLEPSEISAKSAELDAMLRSAAFTGQCRLAPIADDVWNAPLQEKDEFDVSALCAAPSVEPASVVHGPVVTDPEPKTAETHPDEPSKKDVVRNRSVTAETVVNPEPEADDDAGAKVEVRDEVAVNKPRGRRQKCKSPIKCMNFAEPGHKFCADHECHSFGCKEYVRTVSSPNWTLGGLKTLSRLDTAERRLIKRQSIGQYCPKHCCERRCPEIKNYNGWWSGFLYWDNPKVEKFFFCDNERLANSRYCRDHACKVPTCSSNREEYWMLENGSSHQEVAAEVDIDYWWLRWDRKWLLHIAPMCRAHSNRDPDSLSPRDLRTAGDLVQEKNSH